MKAAMMNIEKTLPGTENDEPIAGGSSGSSATLPDARKPVGGFAFPQAVSSADVSVWQLD